MPLPVVIEGAGNSTVHGYNPPHLNGGNVYVAVPMGTQEVRMYKATDPTSSFSEVDSANNPVSTSLTTLTSLQVGTDIHIVQGGFGEYHYHKFSMASDTWVTTNELIDSVASKDQPTESWASIAWRAGVTSDELVVAFNDAVEAVMGDDWQRVAFRTKNDSATTWSSKTALDDGGQVHYVNPVLILGTNDQVHVLYGSKATENPLNAVDQTNGKTISTANALTTPAVTTGLSSTFSIIGNTNGVSFDDAGTQRIEVISSDALITGVEDGSGNISSLANGGAYRDGVTVGSTGEADICSIANNGTDLYAVFADGPTTDLYYNTGTNNNWGTKTEHRDGRTVAFVSATFYVRNSTNTLAIVWREGNDHLYDEVTFGGGAFSADLTSAIFNFTGQALTQEAEYQVDLSAPAFNATAQALTYGNSYTAELTSPAFNFSAQALTNFYEYNAQLASVAFNLTPQAITVLAKVDIDLSASVFNFTATDVTWSNQFSANLTAQSFNFTAQALTQEADHVSNLTTATFGFTAQAITQTADYDLGLTASAFNFAPQAISYSIGFGANLTAPAFNFAPQSVNYSADVLQSLTAQNFNFTAQALDYSTGSGVDLTAPAFVFTPNALSYGGGFDAGLTADAFNFAAQALSVLADYDANLTAGGFNFTAQALNYAITFSADLSVASFNFTEQAIGWVADYGANLTAQNFNFTANAIDYTEGAGLELTAAAFNFTPQAITETADYIAALTSDAFNFSTNAIEVGVVFDATLTAPAFNFTAQAISYEALAGFTADLTAGAFGFSAQSVAIASQYDAMIGSGVFGFTPQAVDYNAGALVDLGSVGFSFVAQSMDQAVDYSADLGVANFSLSALELSWSDGTVDGSLVQLVFYYMRKTAQAIYKRDSTLFTYRRKSKR